MKNFYAHVGQLVLAVTAIESGPLLLAAELPPAVQACAKETDSKTRLACYDREVGGIGADPAPAVVKSPEERFGYRGEVAKDEAIRAKAKEKVTELRSLTSKVARIVRRPQGPAVFTLENGQVWEQRAPDSMFYVDVGDEVTIKAASLGSFLLVSPRGRGTRVSRVR